MTPEECRFIVAVGLKNGWIHPPEKPPMTNNQVDRYCHILKAQQRSQLPKAWRDVPATAEPWSSHETEPQRPADSGHAQGV